MRKKILNQFFCSSFLLPEHREALNRHYASAEEQARYLPSFDEQEQEQWDRLIRQSLQTGKKIRVTFGSGKTCRMVSGAARQYNAGTKELVLAAENGTVKVPLNSITMVEGL